MALQPAHAPSTINRRARKPGPIPAPSSEETTLYQVVQEHLVTFLAYVDIDTGGAGLPTFVTDDFDAFLACSILAHGFLRLRCDGCAGQRE